MRTVANPAAVVRKFLQSTYEAAADLARWYHPAQERA